MILNSEKLLISEFIKISKKGWIKSISNNTGGVGLTFENQLIKSPDSLFFPDYYGIELKCTTRFSNYPYSLFSVSFDGPRYPEIDYIIDTYGHKDYEYDDKKILKIDLNCVEKVVSGNYKFKLSVEKNSEKVFLEVYDLEDNLIERNSFIYLEKIFTHLTVKLNNLAIIHASKKIINDNIYFRYYEFEYYNLKKDMFLDLLLQGKIFVSLESRIARSGKDKGKYKNKNLVFKINKEDIDYLFKKKYFINTDLNINRLVTDEKSYSV